MRLQVIALLALAIGAARPVHAQEADEEPGSRPSWSLQRTMRAFVRELGGEVRGFFPTRGEWDWVVTTRYPDGTLRRQVRRFPAAQTDSALGPSGPVCDSFNSGDFVEMGTLIYHARGEWERWPRVGATRFVPPGHRAGSPVYVEWRREDGRWVISSFGGEGWYQPRVLGRTPGETIRFRGRRTPLRLPLPDTARVAAGRRWYESHEPIGVDGNRITMYGLPRKLSDGDLVPWAILDGVVVYVEAGMTGRTAEVVYIPVDRMGMFQPYQNMTGNGCEG